MPRLTNDDCDDASKRIDVLLRRTSEASTLPTEDNDAAVGPQGRRGGLVRRTILIPLCNQAVSHEMSESYPCNHFC